MSEENSFVDSDTSDELYAVMRAVKKIVSHADIDGVVLGSLVEKISDTTVQRTLRISLSNQRLPDRLRFLLVFMGIVLSIGFLVVPVVNVWVHLLMTTTLAMAVHSAESNYRRSGSSVLRRMESQPRSFGSTYRAAWRLI